MTTINVLKPFRFHYRTADGHQAEIAFTAGSHEIPDDIAKHPYIAKHFADGCVENPEQALKRLRDEKEAAQFSAAYAREQVLQAEATLVRVQAKINQLMRETQTTTGAVAA